MILLLLAQVIFSGGVTINGGFNASSSDLAPTSCSVTSDAAWDGFFWQVTPYDVTATNTQAGDGCLGDSAQYPTPSLP